MLIAFVLALTPTADLKDRDELFPSLGNFGRKVETPKVEKGEKPTAYSQSVDYEWMGGRFAVLTTTLARDPKFKDKYSTEEMKKETVKKVEVNKKTAYLWDRMKAENLDEVKSRFVVVLADDKILMVEQRGGGLDLPDVAKKLDFDKVLKALEKPPPANPK